MLAAPGWHRRPGWLWYCGWSLIGRFFPAKNNAIHVYQTVIRRESASLKILIIGLLKCFVRPIKLEPGDEVILRRKFLKSINNIPHALLGFTRRSFQANRMVESLKGAILLLEV
jgi:hypothetical protein